GAVQRVAAGKTFLDDAARASLAGDGDTGAALQSLSGREFEVLQALVRGHTVAEIAARLCLTHKTVANQQSSIKQKLGVENSAQRVLIALKAGLLPPDAETAGPE
ncbi:MAG: response regulator transcription factor, partial [Burkholderiaceae bacterium]